MPDTALIFVLLVFSAATGLSYLLIQRLLPDDVTQRLGRLDDSQGETKASWYQRIKPAASAFFARLSPLAASDAASAELRIRLLNAGARSASARSAYFASKTVLTFLLPLLMALGLWMASNPQKDMTRLFLLVLAASVGYYTPNLVLSRLIALRQKRLFHAFPDALDLMRVSVQAGLGLDAAIDRVGREMSLASPELSEEFGLTGLELRAGVSRSESLRNLAVRVGLKEIDTMVSMLIQADRFGTSISESLQVHSEALRTRRRLAAEEAAAKLPVKLLVPLVFCVFPALLTVLIGPAVVSLHNGFQSNEIRPQ